MSDLLRKASRPAVCVDGKASVEETVRTMVERRIGAVVVTERGRVAGIFSERDLMQRVVLKKLDPTKTPVAKVMTSPVVSAPVDGDEDEAVQAMVERHIRQEQGIDVVAVDRRDHFGRRCRAPASRHCRCLRRPGPRRDSRRLAARRLRNPAALGI